MKPTLYVNIFQGALGLEAHDGVYTSRAEAVDAAEAYSSTYAFTMTDTGRIDLAPEFSESYHEARDFDAAGDAHIDGLRDMASFSMTARV